MRNLNFCKVKKNGNKRIIETKAENKDSSETENEKKRLGSKFCERKMKRQLDRK